MTTDYDWDQFGILIVDDDDEFLDEAKRVFDGRVPTARTLADAQRAVEAGDTALVLLGPSHAHEAGIKAATLLQEIDPDISLVLVAGTVTAPLLRAALRAGLTDVIEAPVSATKLAEILDQVESRPQRKPAVGAVEPYAPTGPREGRIITVMSAKGGSGKTVMATNLAMLLAQNHDPKRVVVVDADLQFGDVCLVLQLEPRLTVVNAAQEIHRLDNALLDSLLTKHPTGMSVLAAPLEPAFADEISTASMVEILGRLRTMFDYVIVDTASLLDELLLSLLERADEVLFVVDMDLPSVKNAKLALDTLQLIKFPFEKIKLVLNRHNSKARLDVSEMERSLGLQVEASVVSDKLVPRAVNEGVPVVELHARSRVARDFRNVAKLVFDDPSAEDDGGKSRRAR